MAGLETNMVEVFNRFADLTNAEMTKVVRSAISAGSRQLRKEAVSKLRSSIQQSGRSGGMYDDKITDAVRILKFVKRYDEDLTGGVHIMGTTRKGSGTFRARFLEKGTVDRYAKTYNGKPLQKPRYTGKVQAKWFFKSANDAVLPNIESIYAQQIDKAINKINKTKF